MWFPAGFRSPYRCFFSPLPSLTENTLAWERNSSSVCLVTFLHCHFLLASRFFTHYPSFSLVRCKAMSSNTFLRALPSADKDELLKLTTVQELPKPRFATKLAVTAYPHTRRGRKIVFSHIEVYKMVESVAAKMREAGVRPGTVCAFALPMSCEAIIFFYAIVWIAAVAAPIDPDLPPDQFEAAVRRTGAKLLVSPLVDDDDDPLRAKCESVASKTEILEWHIHRTTNEGVVLETHSRVMGAHAAWSGGSGDYKLDPEEIAAHLESSSGIVPLSHYALCEAVKSFVSTYRLSVGMSTMLAPPLHDIHGILILIATFYSGGHIVLPGYGGFAPEKFWEFAKKHDITWLSASPDQILALHEEIDKGRVSGSMQQLTFVRVSGGPCISPELLSRVETSLKTPVYESYGTPEASGFATANIPDVCRHGTVGFPVKGISVAIFDVETRERCLPGVVGEIALCGTHVASRYYDSDEVTESSIFLTEPNEEDESGTTAMKWFATGDRGLIDSDGFLIVHGNSKVMRAADLEAKAKELEAAALFKAEQEAREKEEWERAVAEAARIADEERAEEERLALEKKLEEEKKREEEQMKREEEERAAAEAAAAAEEEKRRIEADRNAALLRAGVTNPDELDDETAAAILSRLEAIEENHRRLRDDVEGKNATELEEMRKRVAEAEAEADRMKLAVSDNGKVVDVRMEELEAAVLAAAASAESSANNTREAVKAAREVADAAYGTNHSQPVEVKASTGDQGALTKTVKVSLDEVEKAMRNHPAVCRAKAFGRKDKRFGAEVYCAIEPKRGARVSEPWLKLHAQSVLPAPMVPKKFYYMSKIPDGITRKELSESSMLQDLSEFSGFSEIKHVKGPQWKPKPKRRTGL